MAERALPDLRARLQLDTTDLPRAQQRARDFSRELATSMQPAERSLTQVKQHFGELPAVTGTAQAAFARLGGVLGGVQGGLSRIGESARGAGVAVAIGLGGASTAALGFIGHATMVALRASEMNVALVALAKANHLNIDALNAQVTAIRKQGIEIGVAQNLVAEFIQGHLDLAKAQQLARVAQDAAVISGQNSTQTLAQLVDGIRLQNIEVLRGAGITISAIGAYKQYAQAHHIAETALTETQKQQILLDEVLKQGIQIQGAYAAALETPSKQLRSIPRLLNDIELNIGQAFEPALGRVITTGYQLALVFRNATFEGEPLRLVFDRLGAGLEVLVRPLERLAPRIKEFLDRLSPQRVQEFLDKAAQLAPLLTAAGAAASTAALRSIPFIGEFLPAINPVLIGIATLVATQPQLRELAGAVGELFGTAFQAVKTVAAPAVDALLGSAGSLIPVIRTATGVLREINRDVQGGAPFWTTLAGALSAAGLSSDQVSTAVGFMRTAWKDAQAIGATVWQTLQQIWKDAGLVADAGIKIGQTAWPQLQQAGRDLADSLGQVLGAFGRLNEAQAALVTANLQASQGIDDTRSAFVRFMTSPTVIETEAFFAVRLPAAILEATSWLKVAADSIALTMNLISESIKVAADLAKGDWAGALRDMAKTSETQDALVLQSQLDLAAAVKATNEDMDGTVEARTAAYKNRMLHLYDTTTSGQISSARQAKEETLQQMREMHQEAVGGSIIPDLRARVVFEFERMQGGASFQSWTMANNAIQQAERMRTGVQGAAQGMASVVGGAFSGLGGSVHGGLDSARGVFNSFARQVNGVLGTFKISIGEIPPFALGGVVPGYAPGQDTVLAALSPGEGVLTPQTVRGLGGASAVKALNRAQGAVHGLGALVANDVGALGSLIGSIAGQCVVAVERWTGHFFPVAMASQMTAWINSRFPVPGSIFVSTIPPFGHTGIVLPGGKVIDSNWGLDERVRIHNLGDIPSIAGYILGFPPNLGNLAGLAAASFGDFVKSLLSPVLNAAHAAAGRISEPWARGMANALIDKVATNIEGRAAGGPVVPERVYRVGERGPELFVSNQPGRIVPNAQTGVTLQINGGYFSSRELARQLAGDVARELHWQSLTGAA